MRTKETPRTSFRKGWLQEQKRRSSKQVLQPWEGTFEGQKEFSFMFLKLEGHMNNLQARRGKSLKNFKGNPTGVS